MIIRFRIVVARFTLARGEAAATASISASLPTEESSYHRIIGKPEGDAKRTFTIDSDRIEVLSWLLRCLALSTKIASR
jgi:hypothetical protein